jgi:hypothetical protein
MTGPMPAKLTIQRCAHCGEQIHFFKVVSGAGIGADHPYRAEFLTFGGWWVHASGPARYMRSCGFGESFADAMANYAKFGTAKAEPATECKGAA